MSNTYASTNTFATHETTTTPRPVDPDTSRSTSERQSMEDRTREMERQAEDLQAEADRQAERGENNVFAKFGAKTSKDDAAATLNDTADAMTRAQQETTHRQSGFEAELDAMQDAMSESAFQFDDNAYLL